MAEIAPPRPQPQRRESSTITQNPSHSIPALRSPRMPNSSPNFSNAPTTTMQAANLGTDISASRRSIDAYLKQLPAGRKSTELERLGKECIEKPGEHWGREWIEMADMEKDVNKWPELRGLAPHGHQVFSESEKSVGGARIRGTRGYVEHSEEFGGVSLNPTDALWHPFGRSFGES